MRTFLTVFIAAGLPLTVLAADDASPASPHVSILLGSRHGHATPVRQGFTHTGGGNIDVAQPSSDTIVVTMTGDSVAGGHPCRASAATMNFDLKQCFEVVCNQPEIIRAKLTLEGRVIGLLRSHCKGGGRDPYAPDLFHLSIAPIS